VAYILSFLALVEVIKVASLPATIKPNPSSPSVTSVNASTLTPTNGAYQMSSISSVSLYPSPTGETFRTSGSEALASQTVAMFSALTSLMFLFALL
jgi:hypothetical protein